MSKYINAEDLRNAMYQETFEKDSKMQKWESGCWIRYKLFENVLDAMPSADVVEVKHGYWELQETDEWFNYEWICSECKGRNDSLAKTNFCPNCGADMRGKENGNQ